MRSKLTDEQVADIRAAAAEGGESLERIAERFGTSKQHVSRLANGEQRAEWPTVDVEGAANVAAAVTKMLEDAGIDPNEDYLAAVAVALAEKLDACRQATSAQAAIAAPGLARALSDAIAELRMASGGGGPRLGRLRGEEARCVAMGLGYPDPDSVNVEEWSGLSAIQLKHQRRVLGLPVQPGLQAVVDDAIARREASDGPA